MICFFLPLFGIPLSEPFGFYGCLNGLTGKLIPTLFPENYAFAERKNFTGNALQSDGIKRGSPNLRLENQPAMAGMDRIGDKRKIEWGVA